jgi:hypothetical protein
MANDMTQKERYWTELVQLKAQAFYLHSYHLECEKVEGYLKMFLALTSSGSIAGWAIWQTLSVVWAVIIAASQALNAVKRFLPWERRGRAVSSLSRDVEDLVLFAEQHWYRVAGGGLSDEDIHDLVIAIKTRQNEAEHKHLAGRPLPEREKHIQAAARRTTDYFRTHYGVEVQYA